MLIGDFLRQRFKATPCSVCHGCFTVSFQCVSICAVYVLHTSKSAILELFLWYFLSTFIILIIRCKFSASALIKSGQRENDQT